VPSLPDHPLLQSHLLDVKVQAKVVGGQLNLAKTFISCSMYEGRPKILYTAHKTTHALEPNWVTILHPNVKQTNALLVVLEGEYAGRFALRICHTHRDSQAMALVQIIDRVAGVCPNLTDIEVPLHAEHLAIVQETNEEKKWHTECMKARRQQARAH
jgi:3-deoxy-D-manno-octulosonic-acid transferase